MHAAAAGALRRPGRRLLGLACAALLLAVAGAQVVTQEDYAFLAAEVGTAETSKWLCSRMVLWETRAPGVFGSVLPASMPLALATDTSQMRSTMVSPLRSTAG